MLVQFTSVPHFAPASEFPTSVQLVSVEPSAPIVLLVATVQRVAELKVTQTKSAIGTKPKQRGTLRALGLGRIGKTNTLPDRPEIRGMVAKVPHLVKVEEV